nr:hypothetical protein [uncultured Desulfobulbus sp.]
MQSYMVVCGQFQYTADLPGKVNNPLFALCNFLDDMLGLRQKRPPRFGEQYSFAQPLKKFDSEFVIKGCNAFTNSGLGEKKLLTGQRK